MFFGIGYNFLFLKKECLEQPTRAREGGGWIGSEISRSMRASEGMFWILILFGLRGEKVIQEIMER